MIPMIDLSAQAADGSAVVRGGRSHSYRSTFISDEHIAAELVEHRKQVIEQDRAFIKALTQAIRRGDEPLAAVVGRGRRRIVP